MKEFKVCIRAEKSLFKIIKLFINKKYIVVDTPLEGNFFITDNYMSKQRNAINILIAHSTHLFQFKGIKDLQEFQHYIVFEDLYFLEERITNIFLCYEQLATSNKNERDENFLPFCKKIRLTNSCARQSMANELENFFTEIEKLSGYMDPVIVRHAIEIQEELLMNAIFDANPKYSDIPRSSKITLEAHEEVALQWDFNGKEFVISVKDLFGRMNPAVMQKYVHFIFKTGTFAKQNLAEQTVSAGLGLYMVIQRANLLSVFITHGKMTEVRVVLMMKEGKKAAINSRSIDIIKV